MNPDCERTTDSPLLIQHVKPFVDHGRYMKAAEYQGPKNVKIVKRPRPIVTERRDAILRVTSTTICGSDLHMYAGLVPCMKKGDIMGHEFMGIVEAVGPEVKDIKVGDRVVASAVIACGECEFCQKGSFSCCETTNPCAALEDLYGHRLSGIFGYSHLTGGFDGGQAEYVRIPIADVNLLKVPDNLPDDKVLFLSDIVCTGWHANDLANVSEGQVVAVWGCGPVGLMAQAWAKFRGAIQVIAIDNDPFRLKVARKQVGSVTINFDKEDVLKTLVQLVPGGPDVCIEAAGFRFPKTLKQKIQTALHMQTDSVDILTEMITAVRKGGTVSVIGDYFGLCNDFPIGALMEKNVHFIGGQVFVQKYWKTLLDHIQSGRFDPTFVITHDLKIDDIPWAYDQFFNHKDNMIKIIVRNDRPSSRTGGRNQCD